MLGGLQMRALRQEFVESQRMTEKAFHDQVLQQNSIPLELVRASLQGQPLPREFPVQWRFYGEVEQK